MTYILSLLVIIVTNIKTNPYTQIGCMILICLALFSSCKEKDNSKQSQVFGDWRLTGYSIGEAFDLNNDGVSHLNLLNEINCENKDVLKFETTGIVSSSASYNPTIAVSKMAAGNAYVFDVNCATGVIGFATDFVWVSDQIFKFNGREFSIINNSFTRIVTDEVKIYDENLSEIIETRDLILTYSKL